LRIHVRALICYEAATPLLATHAQVELKAGAAATLCFTTHAIQCGLRAELQSLCVAIHDRCGNLASNVPAGTEVTLEPTAACQQAGVAAAKLDTPVGTASGGSIKQRLEDGTATFAHVRLKAKHEGVYTARAVCSSRKRALEPALLQLTVVLSNAVTSVELSVSATLPLRWGFRFVQSAFLYTLSRWRLVLRGCPTTTAARFAFEQCNGSLQTSRVDPAPCVSETSISTGREQRPSPTRSWIDLTSHGLAA
jgi:hypothetical protein